MLHKFMALQIQLCNARIQGLQKKWGQIKILIQSLAHHFLAKSNQ
jgi:hypothetical protein